MSIVLFVGKDLNETFRSLIGALFYQVKFRIKSSKKCDINERGGHGNNYELYFHFSKVQFTGIFQKFVTSSLHFC